MLRCQFRDKRSIEKQRDLVDAIACGEGEPETRFIQQRIQQDYCCERCFLRRGLSTAPENKHQEERSKRNL